MKRPKKGRAAKQGTKKAPLNDLPAKGGPKGGTILNDWIEQAKSIWEPGTRLP